VLAKSIGRLIININARNSMCPGTIKARPRLRLDMLDVISKVIKSMMLN